MCGIAGAINLPEIIHARELLAHRGPDSSGVFQEYNVCLVHRRLAIVDLTEAGHQPMCFKNWVITFNGEIYNYLEIKKELQQLGYEFRSQSDTEVILKAYDCWGKACLAKFNGMFAFCIYNRQTRALFIARDKIGIKPLYYYHEDDVFAFGSELKVFPPALLQQKNEKAMLQFLVLGYIPAPAAAYQQVAKLMPGSYLEYHNGRLNIARYWSALDVSVHRPYVIDNYNYALELVEEELSRAVKMQMVADVNVGCFLSGGIDSSLVAALAQQHADRPIKTYSMGFSEQNFDESNYARQVAKHLKTDHHSFTFHPSDLLELLEDFDFYFDEPFGDFASLPLSLLCKKAKEQGITVALSGDGGDELFLGYERYAFAARYHKVFKNQPLWLRKLLIKAMLRSKNDKALKMVYPVRHPSLVNFYQVYATSIKPWDLSKVIDKDFLINSYGKTDINIFDILHMAPNFPINDEKDLSNLDILWDLPDEMLTKSDRASMRFALELRVPLLDANLLEISRAIPNRLLLHHGVKKSILKDILSKHIPRPLFDRPKKGFSVPLGLWFRDQLKSEVEDLSHGLPDFINKRQVNQMIREHLNRHRNHAYTLWNLMRIKKFYHYHQQYQYQA